MKEYLRIVLILLIATACSKQVDPSVLDIQREKLRGIWEGTITDTFEGGESDIQFTIESNLHYKVNKRRLFDDHLSKYDSSEIKITLSSHEIDGYTFGTIAYLTGRTIIEQDLYQLAFKENYNYLEFKVLTYVIKLNRIK